MNEERNTGPGPRDMEAAGKLRTVVGRLIKLMRRETRNEEQLSLTERAALGAIYNHGELLPSDIAKMEKVTTQSMSQVISHLFEIGYILKTPSAEDKRKVLLSLTDAGKTYVEKNRHDKEEWLAKSMHQKLSEDEREMLLSAMKLIEKLLDE